MLGKIKGMLIEIDGKEGLIETVGGVSYRVLLMPQVLGLSPPSPVEIYTHLQIREDAHILFGFDSREQYRMFQTLLAVDGVGPKTAHGILSKRTASEIIQAVSAKDLTSFTSISGLGKKTAQKIILELSSKLKTELDLDQIIEAPVDSDALDALVALGYKVVEAKEMLKPIDPSLPVEKKIQLALKKRT